jgi:CBS domain-containing protein
MKVSDVMSRQVECTRPEASDEEAAARMKALDVGSLPVCDNDRIVGIVTDRDIVVRAIAEGQNPKTTTVRDTMTRRPVFCYDDQDLEEASKIMKQKQIRRLMVLNRNKRLVGMLSLGDLAVISGNDRLSGDTLEQISEPSKSTADRTRGRKPAPGKPKETLKQNPRDSGIQ